MNTSGKRIAITLYKRYDYSLRVLEHLSRCVGIADYQITIHCEPGYPRVMDLAQHYPLPNRETILNPEKLGCTWNIHAALRHGYERSDYVVMVEDDILLAPGALRYFEWANTAFRHQKDVFTVAAYHKQVVPAKDYYAYDLEKWFTPWGWASWADRFADMEANWGWENEESWDCIVSKRARKDRFQVYPLLSRSQNIGAVGGTYCPSPEWHRENQFNPFWAGLPALEINHNTLRFSRELCSESACKTSDSNNSPTDSSSSSATTS